MAEYSPNLLTYLGLGLLRQSAPGPRQNLGTNLLDSLGQYGQAQSAYGQEQRQQQAADQQQQLVSAQLAEEERKRQALARIGGVLSPRTDMSLISDADSPEVRQRAAQVDYGMNIDPKALGGLLNMDPGAPESFGVQGIPGFIGDEPSLMQLGSMGGVRKVVPPEGFRIGMPQTSFDAGGTREFAPKFAGGPTSHSVPMTLAPNQTVPYKERAATAEASGTTRGKAVTEREVNMEGITSVIDQADAILSGAGGATKPTGSGVGSLYDSAAAAFGASPAGAAEADQMRVYGGILTAKVPRFQGAQSNQDVAFYKEMAGSIGNDKLPTERRRKALAVVRQMWARFDKDPSADFSDLRKQSGAVQYTRTGVNKQGQRVGQRADGTIEVIK